MESRSALPTFSCQQHGSAKAWAAGLGTEPKMPHETNCILCAHESLCRVAIIILNIFLSFQILTVFDFLA